MILGQFHHKWTRAYLPLEQVFRTMHAIFSQRPWDLKEEFQDALDQYPELRRSQLDRRTLEHGPSLSQN